VLMASHSPREVRKTWTMGIPDAEHGCKSVWNLLRDMGAHTRGTLQCL
jgi:hypothetical protein